MPMLELTEWHAIATLVENEANALLKRLNITAPPVDAFTFASALNLVVHRDPSLNTRGYSRRRWGIETITVGSKNPGKSERKHFTIAHEIGEVLLAGRIEQRFLEDACNLMAVSLLLPIEWFRRDAEAMDFDLFALKGRYSTASHEVIAYRMLDVRPLIVSIFDNGLLYRRKSSYTTPVRWARQVSPLEMECMRAVSEKAERVSLYSDEMNVSGWPIFREGWERVILKIEIRDDVVGSRPV